MFVLISLYSFGCSDDLDSVNQSKDIDGNVTVYDDLGNFITFSGVYVSIEDFPEYFTISDNNGSFVLENVPWGRYCLIFDYDGFPQKKICIDHSNSWNQLNIKLSQVSSTKVLTLNMTQHGDNLYFGIGTSPAGITNRRRVRYFFSGDDQVSKSSYQFHWSDTKNPFIIGRSVIENCVSKNEDGFMFVRAYGDAYYQIDSPPQMWNCGAESSGIFPCLNPNPSEVHAFKIESE